MDIKQSNCQFCGRVVRECVFNLYFAFVQEAGDEEKKEVSTALRLLREKYDRVHKMVI